MTTRQAPQPAPQDWDPADSAAALPNGPYAARTMISISPGATRNRVGCRATVPDRANIGVPSLKTNQRGKRDPKMHQTTNGNQWCFGIKGDFGVDSNTRLIPAVVMTAVNTADGSVVDELLRGEEAGIWGSKAYDRQREATTTAAPAAQNHTHDKGNRYRPLTAEQETANRYTSSVRPKVEHPIGTIKRVSGFRKVRYWDISKIVNRLFVASALWDLFMVRRRTLAAGCGVSNVDQEAEYEPVNAVENGPNEAWAESRPRSRTPFRSSPMDHVREMTKSDVL